MAKLKLFSTIFSKLSSLIKKDGQVIISKDSRSLYIDIDEERVEITDWVDINTEEELLATLSPLANKYYYTKDTNKIWRYINSKWEKLNTVVTWETIEGKPSNLVYIDEDSEEIPELINNSSNDIVTFTSNDGEGTEWTNVATMVSDESHSSLFSKISTMFKNVRYLFKMLGTNDISSIGDGTVTGSISTLNSNLEQWVDITSLFFENTSGISVYESHAFYNEALKSIKFYLRGVTTLNTANYLATVAIVSSQYRPIYSVSLCTMIIDNTALMVANLDGLGQIYVGTSSTPVGNTSQHIVISGQYYVN